MSGKKELKETLLGDRELFLDQEIQFKLTIIGRMLNERLTEEEKERFESQYGNDPRRLCKTLDKQFDKKGMRIGSAPGEWIRKYNKFERESDERTRD
ncbi:hypothetical protein ES695_11655 [Candidatus Atribacteria bacterium 1244-E10-H5-B2]|nr:MAG: hypothetical protein ES695_11655 [Candidatus Atribacteria bacterium 1244-E10-H5-B2]